MPFVISTIYSIGKESFSKNNSARSFKCTFVLTEMFHPDHARRQKQNQSDKYLLRVYSVVILLITDSGHVRNNVEYFIKYT